MLLNICFKGPDMLDDIGSLVPLYSMSVVSLGDRVIAMGGTDGSKYSDRIFELTCKTEYDCTWKQMKQKLNIARSNFVAMPIYDELVSCSD